MYSRSGRKIGFTAGGAEKTEGPPFFLCVLGVSAVKELLSSRE
jgi:hypothetical protein